MREGVCCTCQSVHPVRSSSQTSDNLFGFDEGFDLDGETGEWVMDTHDAFGSHCKGSGTMPQAVLSEEEPSAKLWSDKTDDELKNEVRRICRVSKSDEEVKDRMRDELGYPYGDAAVTSTGHGSMRMTMVMFHGPRGNTISI